MRESRLSGSEGGAILISRPYPYPRVARRSRSDTPYLATGIIRLLRQIGCGFATL